MKPTFYLDIVVDQKNKGRQSPLATTTLIFIRLHSFFCKMPDRFALAFPDMTMGAYRRFGKRVRVFSDDKDALANVQNVLAEFSLSTSNFRVGGITSIPADFSGEWVEYRRFRIPALRPSRIKTRIDRMSQGEFYPYFRVGSHSTGRCFSLHVQKIASQPFLTGKTDGYGLSTSCSPLSLPDLP